MFKKFTLLTSGLFVYMLSFSQVVINSLAVPYTQDFNTLASASGSLSSIVPTGWSFLETGTNANTTYLVDNGGNASGNTFSYGTASNTERAFGGLLSGSLVPTIGVQFTNTSGSTITSITVTYTGEQWRLGTAGRADRLDFQYSQDANALNNGTWTNEDNLDFTAPITAGTLGALDGNLSANRTLKTFTLTGLNIQNGTSFWFRWSDFNASGADDGLAIDDFSVNFSGVVLPPCNEPAAQPTSLVLTPTPTTISGGFTAPTPAADEYLVVRSTSNTLSAFPVDGTNYSAGQAFGGGVVVLQTTATSFQDINLQPATTYYYFVFALNNEECAGGPNYTNNNPLENNVATLPLPSCVTPATITNLNLSSTNTTVSGTFTAASGNNKYLVVISSNSTLSASPVNGVVYIAGQSFGGGTVVSFTTATSFSASGLTVNSMYYVFVFTASVECNGEPFYSTTDVNASISTTNNSGIPVGYYDGAAGLSCQPLKSALVTISSTGYVQLTYTPGVWSAYQYTDIRRNDANTANIIWDIYSDNPTGPEPYTYTYQVNQCGNYTNEGDCYNREHSTPQSWFSGAYPMYSDVHHLYPTDGKVNAYRSNFPYGEVTSTTITSLNGSKLGTGNNFGYTATVFEPINEYKGDVARTSLYMATRYENEIINTNWSANGTANEVFLSATDQPDAALRKLQVYDTWYLKTIFKWMQQDPVSVKEIDRNNAIYYQSGQANRNPFVDHPEYAYLIWECTGVVPVTILNFKTVKAGETIVLSWYATYETSFRQFEIERSTDGIVFQRIGELPGRNLANYSFTDNDLPAAATVYYRLKMVDADGKFSYSSIVAQRLDNVYNTVIYPNPASDAVNIKLSKGIGSQSYIVITDVTGRIVKKQLVALNQTNILIDVKNLVAGRYFVQMANGIQLSQKSFVIIK